MPILSAVVALLGILTVLNVLLVVGVIRRLRSHEQRLAQLFPDLSVPEHLILPAGRVVGGFSATTLDGETVTAADLQEPTLVSFVSTHCGTCRAMLPELLDAARSMPGGRARVLTVVVGEDEAVFEWFRERLAPVSRVARDVEDGLVPSTFEIQGYPAFAVIADGLVRSSGAETRELSLPVG